VTGTTAQLERVGNGGQIDSGEGEEEEAKRRETDEVCRRETPGQKGAGRSGGSGAAAR